MAAVPRSQPERDKLPLGLEEGNKPVCPGSGGRVGGEREAAARRDFSCSFWDVEVQRRR